MNETHTSLVKSLFQQAVDLPAEQRDPFLRQECGSNGELLDELRELLAHVDAVPGEFLQGGSSARLTRTDTGAFDAALTNADDDDLLGIPEKFGKYEVLRLIGVGGMGAVYEAIQPQPRRTVALKVLRLGFSSSERIRRFEREADLLGQLRHSGIAHVYEAGLADTPSGKRPYLAMELVDGQALDQWIQDEGPSIAERVRLMIETCDAVEHAHQKGIVHRDLKPSNILVDAQGRAKVVDFGIARTIESEFQASTLETRPGQLLGTLPYMSPEQVFGDPRILDVRSDVYALGVIFYELLSGRLPYDIKHRSVPEAARIIREDEPTRLGAFHTTLRGDLDTIVAKALEKDPIRRYPSAGALAEDFRRHLSHVPIQARPPRAFYQMQKFARRNKALVSGVTTAILALALGLGLAVRGWMTTVDERDAKQSALLEEKASREVSDAVTEFLAELLAAVNPGTLGKDVTVRQVLDRSAANIGDRFSTQPLVEARIRRTIGESYIGLGDFNKAEEQLQQAVDLLKHAKGEDDARTLEAIEKLATAHYYQGRLEEAAAEFESILLRVGGKPGADPHQVAESMANLAFLRMRMKRYEEAEPLFTEALSILEKIASPEDATVLDTESNLAQLYLLTRQPERAEPIYVDLLERSKRVRGAEHPETALILATLGTLYTDYRPEKALPILKEAYDIQRRVLSESHAQTLITLNNLSTALKRSDATQEAIELVRHGLSTAREVYGETDPRTLMLLEQLGNLYNNANQFMDAEPQYREYLRLTVSQFGENDPRTINAQRDMGIVTMHLGDYASAAQRFEDVLARTPKAAPNETHYWVLDRILLAQCYQELARFEEAEALLLGLISIEESSTDPPSAELVLSLSDQHEEIVRTLVDLYDAWGKPTERDRWSASLKSAPSTSSQTTE